MWLKTVFIEVYSIPDDIFSGYRLTTHLLITKKVGSTEIHNLNVY